MFLFFKALFSHERNTHWIFSHISVQQNINPNIQLNPRHRMIQRLKKLFLGQRTCPTFVQNLFFLPVSNFHTNFFLSDAGGLKAKGPQYLEGKNK
jgi:hypothetical protein